MNTQRSASDGVGFGAPLALLFIGLKLGHVIAWSWWWVLSPLWIPIAVLVIVAIVASLVTGVVGALRSWRR